MSSSICVIGAGPAGLAVARALNERALDYVHLERHTSPGGAWDIDNPGGPMYESAHFISSKTVSGFSGFPMPDSFPDYPSHRQILQYLRSFADGYGLTERITFGVEVIDVHRDGNDWVVTRSDGSTTRHTAVIVCTGSQWFPNAPTVAGFTGEVRHSQTYRSATEFAGKRVLVVGGGNSACDIACDAARNADYTAISMRRGYWFVPKHVFGVPADIVGGAGSFLPKRMERALVQPLLRLLTGNPTRLGLQKPDHKLFETHPLVNSLLLHHLQHGDVTARPGIQSADGRAVTFTDGSSDEFDLILLATGYQHRVPVAQRYFGNEQHPDLYLNCFSREHEGLFGVGFLETNSGAYQLFDQQAHLVAAFLAEHAANTAAAGEFEHRIRTDRPDLSNGLKFDASARHLGYVDSDAYLKYVKKVAREQGWPLHSPATRPAAPSATPAAVGA